MSDSVIDRISPIFFAWHDSGNAPHFHKEESYGRRVVPVSYTHLDGLASPPELIKF